MNTLITITLILAAGLLLMAAMAVGVFERRRELKIQRQKQAGWLFVAALLGATAVSAYTSYRGMRDQKKAASAARREQRKAAAAVAEQRNSARRAALGAGRRGLLNPNDVI